MILISLHHCLRSSFFVLLGTLFCGLFFALSAQAASLTADNIRNVSVLQGRTVFVGDIVVDHNPSPTVLAGRLLFISAQVLDSYTFKIKDEDGNLVFTESLPIASKNNRAGQWTIPFEFDLSGVISSQQKISLEVTMHYPGGGVAGILNRDWTSPKQLPVATNIGLSDITITHQDAYLHVSVKAERTSDSRTAQLAVEILDKDDPLQILTNITGDKIILDQPTNLQASVPVFGDHRSYKFRAKLIDGAGKTISNIEEADFVLPGNKGKVELVYFPSDEVSDGEFSMIIKGSVSNPSVLTELKVVIYSDKDEAQIYQEQKYAVLLEADGDFQQKTTWTLPDDDIRSAMVQASLHQQDVLLDELNTPTPVLVLPSDSIAILEEEPLVIDPLAAEDIPTSESFSWLDFDAKDKTWWGIIIAVVIIILIALVWVIHPSHKEMMLWLLLGASALGLQSNALAQTPPEPVSAPDLQSSSDSGIDDDDITDKTKPSFDVICSSVDNVITLYLNNVASGDSLTCDTVDTKTITMASDLAIGVYNVTYTDRDPITGNESAHSPSLSIEIVLFAPSDFTFLWAYPAPKTTFNPTDVDFGAMRFEGFISPKFSTTSSFFSLNIKEVRVLLHEVGYVPTVNDFNTPAFITEENKNDADQISVIPRNRITISNNNNHYVFGVSNILGLYETSGIDVADLDREFGVSLLWVEEVSAGSYDVYIQPLQEAFGVALDSKKIIADNTPPSVTVTFPDGTGPSNQPTKINIACADASSGCDLNTDLDIEYLIKGNFCNNSDACDTDEGDRTFEICDKVNNCQSVILGDDNIDAITWYDPVAPQLQGGSSNQISLSLAPEASKVGSSIRKFSADNSRRLSNSGRITSDDLNNRIGKARLAINRNKTPIKQRAAIDPSQVWDLGQHSSAQASALKIAIEDPRTVNDAEVDSHACGATVFFRGPNHCESIERTCVTAPGVQGTFNNQAGATCVPDCGPNYTVGDASKGEDPLLCYVQCNNIFSSSGICLNIKLAP